MAHGSLRHERGDPRRNNLELLGLFFAPGDDAGRTERRRAEQVGHRLRDPILGNKLLHCKTLQLLKLADFVEGDIKLTPLGQRFIDMDVDQRKKLMGGQALANIPLASHIKRVLDERPSHRAPATRFREELEDYMSEDYAERTLRTVINLGRYGELFAYDENAQTFSYENPE